MFGFNVPANSDLWGPSIALEDHPPPPLLRVGAATCARPLLPAGPILGASSLLQRCCRERFFFHPSVFLPPVSLAPLLLNDLLGPSSYLEPSLPFHLVPPHPHLPPLPEHTPPYLNLPPASRQPPRPPCLAPPPLRLFPTPTETHPTVTSHQLLGNLPGHHGASPRLPASPDIRAEKTAGYYL